MSTSENRATSDALEKPATLRILRSSLWKFAVAILVGYVFLTAGVVWAIIELEEKNRIELVQSAVGICERGVPVRQATNRQSDSLRTVAYGTSAFLMGVAPTLNTPKLQDEALKLSNDLNTLGGSQFKVPVQNCEELYKRLLP